ncbi:MAG: hypothetical protein QF927_02430 [Verrucomicrobiota bacterium]|nr:hypothetical protein [Verrucomicrobiota bacterium]
MLADVSGILTLRKVINHGNPRWRATAKVNGRRRQRFFRTKEEGQGWLIEAHRQHPCEQFWKALPLAEKQRVMLAYQSGENKGAASDLRPVALAEAASRYLLVRGTQNLRPLTLRQIRWKLKLLVEAFGGLQCHELTAAMLEGWFAARNWKRSTIEGVIAKVGPFLNWCIRESYCIYNPLKYIILPKEDERQPCIFSPDQVSDLMAAATSRDPGMVPYLALGIFAGVRPEELMRLGWEDITTHGVSINGHKAKTRQRRLITISENLKGWLSLGGDLPPRSKRRRLEALRQASGVTWGHDIMRHSFASYHLAYHGSPDRTAHELGHRDTQMLFRHYRQLVTREAAEAFWAIRP